jgi:hypothetical protein
MPQGLPLVLKTVAQTPFASRWSAESTAVNGNRLFGHLRRAGL